MKSIGIWYEVTGEELPQLEVHINLWNLKKCKKNTAPFIDFGIGIPGFRKIKVLDMLLPFHIDKSEITDLYEYVRDPDTARLIFNEVGCEISSKDRYAVIKLDNFDNLKLLISIKNGEDLDSFIKCKSNDETTILSINFEELKKDDKFNEFNDLYFRFRINSNSIKNHYFVLSKKRIGFLKADLYKRKLLT